MTNSRVRSAIMGVLIAVAFIGLPSISGISPAFVSATRVLVGFIAGFDIGYSVRDRIAKR